MNIHVKNNNIGLENQMLLDFTEFIYTENNKDKQKLDYHLKHIQLVQRYALLINQRLNANLSSYKLSYISLSHDLFKERGLDPAKQEIIWRNFHIPQELNRYVRTNLDVLEEYGLDEFFNTDIQLHALASGIFLRKEFGIKDPEILYPVMFHSCPIISVYETLSPRIKTSVDIIMLSDKLSSNWLKINELDRKVPIDLDLAVFGKTGQEFNYTLGLFLARLLGQGNSKEEQSVAATDYYYKRFLDMNPIIGKNESIKKLGGGTTWPKRKSQALRKH